MPESTTTPAPVDPADFVASLGDVRRRADAEAVLELMQRVTGQPPVMWGSSIVGFGSYHYVYESGREGDSAAVGFSPRRSATTVYLMDGFDEYADLLGRLGPHSTGKACLYLKRVWSATGAPPGVDLEVLAEPARRSYAHPSAQH